MKTKVRSGFSDRNNIKCINRDIQFCDLDERTRIIICNYLYLYFIDFFKDQNNSNDDLRKTEILKLFKSIYIFVYVLPFDEFPNKGTFYLYNRLIKDQIISASYDDVFTLLEYLCDYLYKSKISFMFFKENKNLYDTLNRIFEEEYVGYRFVNKQIIPITNHEEIEEINSACCTPFDLVNISIKKSINFIADRKNPDYQNSIKESVLAIETLCNQFDKTNGTLNAILKSWKKRDDIYCHPHLNSAITELYSFASEANQIRHGNSSETSGNVGFEEAKLVLTICSSVINYIISKNIKYFDKEKGND